MKSPAQLFDLTGRTALVTGSSKGLGWAMAEALAAAGATVALNARDPAALAEKQKRLVDAGLKAEIFPFDASDPKAAASGLQAVAQDFGKLDILVANTAFGLRKPALDYSDQDWDRMIEGCLSAGFRLARDAARGMVQAGFGRIVFTSSINATIVRPSMVGYAAAKTGMLGMTRALAVELAQTGVTVNAIAPGYFLTDGNAQTRAENPEFEPRIAARAPIGRWGRPEELATALLYLASPASSFTTGSVVTVDGAMTVAI
jgi:gluconate 5-dehydrogenase